MNESRKFYIDALINAGYYEKDLKGMDTNDLANLYYKELKNYIKNIKTAKQ